MKYVPAVAAEEHVAP